MLPLVALLAGCAVGTPMPSAEGSEQPDPTPRPPVTTSPSPDPVPGETESPAPTPSATAAPSPTPTDPPAVVPLATSVVLHSRAVVAFAADGEPLATVRYDETDHAGAAERLAVALGMTPEVSATGAIGSGCDADQTVYDFGGFVLRSPGYTDSLGSIEAEVGGMTTATGIPIRTVGGVRIGMTRSDFDAAVADAVPLTEYSGRTWVGFDRVDPDAPDADAAGAIARFDGDRLAQWKTPIAFHGVC